MYTNLYGGHHTLCCQLSQTRKRRFIYHIHICRKIMWHLAYLHVKYFFDLKCFFIGYMGTLQYHLERKIYHRMCWSVAVDWPDMSATDNNENFLVIFFEYFSFFSLPFLSSIFFSWIRVVFVKLFSSFIHIICLFSHIKL